MASPLALGGAAGLAGCRRGQHALRRRNPSRRWKRSLTAVGPLACAGVGPLGRRCGDFSAVAVVGLVGESARGGVVTVGSRASSEAATAAAAATLLAAAGAAPASLPSASWMPAQAVSTAVFIVAKPSSTAGDDPGDASLNRGRDAAGSPSEPTTPFTADATAWTTGNTAFGTAATTVFAPSMMAGPIAMIEPICPRPSSRMVLMGPPIASAICEPALARAVAMLVAVAQIGDHRVERVFDRGDDRAAVARACDPADEVENVLDDAADVPAPATSRPIRRAPVAPVVTEREDVGQSEVAEITEIEVAEISMPMWLAALVSVAAADEMTGTLREPC